METTWVCNIGEQARQIRVHFNKYIMQNDIVVLGETTLFILLEHEGEIRFQKRYHFAPSCLIPYHLRGSGNDLYLEPEEDVDELIYRAGVSRFDQGGLRTPGFMTLMSSFEGYLMIYKDTKLAWTTKLSTIPIFLERATFQNKQGLIVTFSDSGNLAINYLGTD